MSGHGSARSESFGLECDWCSAAAATIVLEGKLIKRGRARATQPAFRLCLPCAIEAIDRIKEEIKRQRLRYLVDTGKGIVLEDDDETRT